MPANNSRRKYEKLAIVAQIRFFKIPITWSRVRTGPGKPGKSWNFVMVISRTGKSWKKASGPGKSWKSV